METNYKSETKNFFDKISKTWANNYLDKNNPIAQRTEIFYKFILGFSKKKLKILDVGCGTGDIASFLTEKGNSLIALDISKLMLEEAKKRFFDKSIEWIKIGETGLLPFEDNAFDVILISSVLEYHDDPNLLIAESYRVLKKPGLFIFTVPDMRHPVRIFEEKYRFLSKLPFWLIIKLTKFQDYFKTIKISKNRMPLSEWVSIVSSNGFICELDQSLDGPLKYIKALK